MSPLFAKIKAMVLEYLAGHKAEITADVNAQIQALGDDLKAHIDAKINEVLTAQK